MFHLAGVRCFACQPFCNWPNQKSCAKTQSTRRWFIVSAFWSQRRQREGWLRSRLASLSAVQHLLCATSHMKKRHLAGAQVLQILSQENSLTDPWNAPYMPIFLYTVHLSWVSKYENPPHQTVVPHQTVCPRAQGIPQWYSLKVHLADLRSKSGLWDLPGLCVYLLVS